jgi:hypothetical protein
VGILLIENMHEHVSHRFPLDGRERGYRFPYDGDAELFEGAKVSKIELSRIWLVDFDQADLSVF